ncbi:unnamed protein product [Rotaria sp. Silwood1]|nr:unnamed protein product [Rotaria sp. Silwood1]
MINDPPIIFIALIDCLRERNNVDLFYNFTNYSTAAIFTILLHLLHSLPQPLISYKMQDKIRICTTTTTLAPCAVCTVSIGLVGGGTTLVACNTICAGIGTALDEIAWKTIISRNPHIFAVSQYQIFIKNVEIHKNDD